MHLSCPRPPSHTHLILELHLSVLAREIQTKTNKYTREKKQHIYIDTYVYIYRIVDTTPPNANGADAMAVTLSFLGTTSDSETRKGAVVIEHPLTIVHTSAILHPSAFNACAHLDQ